MSLLTLVTTVIGKNGMGKNSLRDTYRHDSICGIWQTSLVMNVLFEDGACVFRLKRRATCTTIFH